MTRVRKAVIPAAGLGTRFLPVTRSVPKELLPILDTPVIEWTVEEAVAAGVDEVYLVISPGKNSVRRYFDPDPELLDVLRARGKHKLAERLANTGNGARIGEVVQEQPLGLGHAILQARAAIGDEPFAVLLPDDIYLAEPGALAQLVEAHAAHGLSVVGLAEVPLERVSRYGIVRPGWQRDGVIGIAGVVEKPAPEAAPSRLSMPGRYVFQPEIFEHLARTRAGVGDEIQLVDGMRPLAEQGRLLGRVLEGRHFDTGNPIGMLAAGVAFALRRGDAAALALRGELRELLQPDR